MYRLGVSVTFGLALAILLSIAVPQPALAVSCGNNKSHNAIFGQRQLGDELVHFDHIKKSSKLFQVVTQDIYYPSKTDKSSNITFIEIYDQYTDGNGGCALITSGGVGSQHVNFHLKSKRGHGIDFVIRIYGKTRRW